MVTFLLLYMIYEGYLWLQLIVCDSHISILVLLGSNGLHDVTQQLARGCQHGGSGIYNGLAGR